MPGSPKRLTFKASAARSLACSLAAHSLPLPLNTALEGSGTHAPNCLPHSKFSSAEPFRLMEPDVQRSRYQYPPLPSLSTVRLVRLYGAADPNEALGLEFELLDRHSLLRPRDSFDAIPYVWGKPDFTHRIVSRSLGQYIAITARVDAILR